MKNTKTHFMKKISIFILLLLSLQNFFSQQFPKQASLIEEFVPKGWKVLYHVQGDLNKDKVDDHAVIIENTDPGNFKKNEGLGTDRLNLNPRILLVFFKNQNGYALAAVNNKGFIQAENSEDNPCLADPISETQGISIEKGLLKVAFNYWLSCGSWYVNDAVYTFRFQNDHFDLIGFDHSDYHRANGEKSSTSINFSTKKKSTTTGGNMSDEDSSREKTVWTTFRTKKSYDLQTIDEKAYFEISENNED
jgi:hypothetical protein